MITGSWNYIKTETLKERTVEITDKVLEIMRNEAKPLNAGKITEIGGLDRKEVDKAMAKLKKEEKIVSPKRCYWEPA